MATTSTSKKQDVADEEDDIFYYIGVKASPFAPECVVFGLSPKEVSAIRSRFPLSPANADILNGVKIKGAPFSVINALAELGYRVICSAGESETLWTLQREN
ncbi:hypothetical protein PUN28_005853 [Cardiocondyla obscurior]|uniref:Uncharacterized protein n=1 Tax=Cardiocondyla obscurior TaxID=286306 RepID=A0AAW2G7W7_9HYME